MIRVTNLSKSFENHQIFNDLSLEVMAGELLCLLGPSGSGKTTLLDIIAGCTAPDAGRVEASYRLSYVFQDARLLPWETVLDNASYAMDPHMPRRQREEKALELLEKLEMADEAYKFPSEISGGMARRAALARAILAPHDALLLDEPFSSLDPSLRTRIMDRIGGLLSDKAVILVTHDYATASRLADRVYLLTMPPVRMHPLNKDDLKGAIARIEAMDTKLDLF